MVNHIHKDRSPQTAVGSNREKKNLGRRVFQGLYFFHVFHQFRLSAKQALGSGEDLIIFLGGGGICFN